jgi:hypothetical protein
MAKRFTDGEKWIQDWYLLLPMKYKLFWIFLLDTCDCAGVWRPNIIVANRVYGFDIDLTEALGLINQEKERIAVLPNGRWFIKGFIEFQYGRVLSENSSVHRGILKVLDNNGVSLSDGKGYLTLRQPLGKGYLTLRQPLGKGYLTLKDKDKDSSLKKIPINVTNGKRLDFEEIWGKYPKKDGRKEAKRHFEASVKTSEDMKRIEQALTNYLSSEVVKKGFIKNGSTWFNNWEDWVNYEEGNVTWEQKEAQEIQKKLGQQKLLSPD